MSLDFTPLAMALLRGLVEASGPLLTRLARRDRDAGARLLAEVARRIEERHAEAIGRMQAIELRVRDLEAAQAAAGVRHHALERRLEVVLEACRVTRSRLDVISETLSAIRTQLDALVPVRTQS